MTIHITGEELGALIKAFADMSVKDLITALSSDELWISVRYIEDGVYKTVITNHMAKFQD